jgi:hypothetical protein
MFVITKHFGGIYKLMVITRVRIHNTLFSSQLTIGPNKLVLHFTGLERLARDKHSSLLDPFISYEENEVL